MRGFKRSDGPQAPFFPMREKVSGEGPTAERLGGASEKVDHERHEKHESFRAFRVFRGSSTGRDAGEIPHPTCFAVQLLLQEEKGLSRPSP
jgi:hypothetical protein